jgi:hypothetical protein
VGSGIKWEQMGEDAARSGKLETACPYAVGGTAFNAWIRGFHRGLEAVKKSETK